MRIVARGKRRGFRIWISRIESSLTQCARRRRRFEFAGDGRRKASVMIGTWDSAIWIRSEADGVTRSTSLDCSSLPIDARSRTRHPSTRSPGLYPSTIPVSDSNVCFRSHRMPTRVPARSRATRRRLSGSIGMCIPKICARPPSPVCRPSADSTAERCVMFTARMLYSSRKRCGSRRTASISNGSIGCAIASCRSRLSIVASRRLHSMKPILGPAWP